VTIEPEAKADAPKKSLPGAKLTEGSIPRLLYGMALPLAGGILATMSFHMVDTYFVSKLGADALAALSFTIPVVMVAVALSVGLGAGTSTVVAIAAGKHDDSQVRTLITNAMILALLVSLLICGLGIATIEPLFRALGASDKILPLIHEYMLPWYLGLVFMLGPMVGLAALRALGITKLQASVMISMAVANALLDPLLIFGWWIFPRLEIQGAAIASLIVRMLAMFYILQVLNKMHLLVMPLSLERTLASWRKILHVGIPAIATNLIIPVSGSVMIALIAVHGPEAVAGFGVAQRIESIALIAFYALSAVIGPFCGQNLGAGKTQRLFAAQKVCALFCVATGLVMALLLAVVGEYIAGLFSHDPAVVATTGHYLLIVPVSYCAYGVVMAVNASFNGLGRPLPGVVISSARVIVVLLPLAFAGNALFGLPGLFAAVALSNLAVGLAAHLWIKRAIADITQKHEVNRQA
jgi:putative MATE family efflux protein